MGFIKTILLYSVLLFNTIRSEPIQFESCGNGTLVIHDISVEPFPLQKSVESTVTVYATLNQAFSAGDYDITVNLGGLQIFSKSGDVCSLDKNICPQQAGDKTFIKNFSIPNLAPAGSYSAKATIHNNDEWVACYTFNLDLNTLDS
jgi:hypothetical protein